MLPYIKAASSQPDDSTSTRATEANCSNNFGSEQTTTPPTLSRQTCAPSQRSPSSRPSSRSPRPPPPAFWRLGQRWRARSSARPPSAAPWRAPPPSPDPPSDPLASPEPWTVALSSQEPLLAPPSSQAALQATPHPGRRHTGQPPLPFPGVSKLMDILI